MFTLKLQPTGEKQNIKNHFYRLYKQSTGKLLLLAFIVALFTGGCKKGDHDCVSCNQYLVSATKIGDFTKEQLNVRFNDKTGPGYLAALDKYTISVYKIVYKTKFINDSSVLASGCIIVPQNAPAPSMISLEHGDILNFENFAPSNYMPGPSSVATAYNEGSAEASDGFIVVLPDYLGYGASKNLFHPPFHRASLATSCADMIQAAKEFLHDIHQPWNNKLYLQGYSEGGLANLSLQKYIEENHLPFNLLKAASTGGAPSHITKIAQYIFNYPSDPGSVKNYLAVILFYNSFYPQLHRPVSDYLIEPYATDVQNNGLNATINTSLHSILNPLFVNGINTGTDQGFLSALADNDVYDWKPVAPLRLYHGTADITIPYFNSEDAWNAMTARGANVELVPLAGLDHDAAIQPYVTGSIQFFKAHP